jgi:hypothetical protein
MRYIVAEFEELLLLKISEVEELVLLEAPANAHAPLLEALRLQSTMSAVRTPRTCASSNASAA